MLENRSFDHLLGYLDHPNRCFPNLGRIKPSCPVRPDEPRGEVVRTTPTAEPTLGVDPDHSPEAVREQIFGRDRPAAGAAPNMRGFVHSYALKISGHSPRKMNPVLAIAGKAWRWLKARWQQLLHRPNVTAVGADIMRCFSPAGAPVLADLARHYAVFDHWFASVPGETWPNRNFAHAATSHGETKIKLKFYDDPTIFDRLGDGGWRIYHQGVPQVWAFPSTWITPERRANFRDTSLLFADLANGDLPKYTFIEPDHGFGPGEGNSQHPGNNTTSDASFRGGEDLIARIYNALAANHELFTRTLFLVTYDEHGGLFDHEKPIAVPQPDHLTDDDGFDFRMSGIRVPAVAISPLIPQGWLDCRKLDHAAIPRTVRAQFGRDAEWLTERDRQAADILDGLPLLDNARTDRLTFDTTGPADLMATTLEAGPAIENLNDLQASLASLAGAVHNALTTGAGEPFAAMDAGLPAYEPTANLAAAAQDRQLEPAAQRDIAEVLAQFSTPPGPG